MRQSVKFAVSIPEKEFKDLEAFRKKGGSPEASSSSRPLSFGKKLREKRDSQRFTKTVIKEFQNALRM
jgi:hypothetical protein